VAFDGITGVLKICRFLRNSEGPTYFGQKLLAGWNIRWNNIQILRGTGSWPFDWPDFKTWRTSEKDAVFWIIGGLDVRRMRKFYTSIAHRNIAEMNQNWS
jgi:hypothetical protein